MNPQPLGELGAPDGSTASGTAVPIYHRLPIVLLAVVVCCPLGIVLLWQSSRRPAALVALGVLVLWLACGTAMVLVLRSRGQTQPTFPDSGEPLHRDHDPQRGTGPNPEEAIAAAQEAEKADKAKRHVADVTSYRKKTVAERAAAIRRACPAGDCDRRLLWIIVEAAATDSERKGLTAIAEAAINAENRVLDARSEADGRKKREDFAKRYDQQLLDRGLNPQGVTAAGPSNKTLRIQGWFCSRQFAHDFDATAARAAGFTRLECNNGLDMTTMDF